MRKTAMQTRGVGLNWCCHYDGYFPPSYDTGPSFWSITFLNSH